MRIIGGSARGRRLVAPRGGTTRPTSDRVRESLFATLSSRRAGGESPWESTRVLDLFAGSGALGLEALSRGAESVVFVENNRSALAALRTNIDAVNLPGASVVTVDAWRYAETSAGSSFDLVLCDPPYAVEGERISTLVASLIRGGRLAVGCDVVIERDIRSPQAPWPQDPDLIDLDRRAYGETALWYGRFEPSATRAT